MFIMALLTSVVLRPFSAQARVVTDFNECNAFFYKQTEPIGMDQNAKKICQILENNAATYATLYSVFHRTPLYSAYRFDPDCKTGRGRPTRWYLEPQLSQPEDLRLHSMVPETVNNKNAYKENQAITDDFSYTGYDRGHLNPNLFQCDAGRMATFTLTNVAPMDACFNSNQWGKWEKKLKTFLLDMASADFGRATVYIVTGTVPNANLRIPQREISEEYERVTVPSHIWTAVCYEHNDSEDKSFSFGYIGENRPEGGISLMSVSDLNTKITNLYSKLSEIRIFEDSCFGDNNKLENVKAEFQILIDLQVNQNVQMSSDIQNTYLALKRTVSSDNYPEKKFKLSEMTVKLAFESMRTYVSVAENLKLNYGGVSCLITHAKPLVRNYIGKRDVSGVSDAVECLLTPEKQKTAADGSPCLTSYDNEYSCQCNTEGETKSCCSSPCHYQDKFKFYGCYSGQTLIECSPQYSLITYKGERCLDNHPCATYGQDYYWCRTSDSWEYCSPPLWKSKTQSGKYCRTGHACAKYGSSQMWCFTDDRDNYDYCCTCKDSSSALNGQTCRSDHPCGYHDKTYLWCYTDYVDNWDYCCDCEV
ncbi:uncharacterized protein LOC130569003 [Triplophysa rosa]|uniref:Endonuclease domain containing-like protein n=1 Tax=Triplophysa rosa TaxID=992332 RepID=A0A9W7WFA8_TRIRA|nr:uncharacterized protein LOC130569003 [Triplophysa rosa]KAI7797029.1 endonuclease domain containing-like protein [Triplophysa rosa]